MIALVLAHMTPDKASLLLSGLPPTQQAQVAHRIAVMDRTSPEIVRAVETTLERKLSSMLQPAEMSRVGGVDPLVNIINRSDRTTERHILESLDESSPELAEEVRKLMFVFEDLLLLDDRSIQALLKEVEMKDVTLALKGTSEEVQEKIFRNMSQRAATMLKEDMAYMGPQRRRSIEEAQQKIVSVVRRLEEAGFDTAAFVRALADRFGAGRLVWGSDVGQSPAPYAEKVARLQHAAGLLSAEERTAFFGGNAERIYG